MNGLYPPFNPFMDDGSDRQKLADVEMPSRFDTLPDGRDALVCGEPEKLADFNHLQGDNSLNFKGTCGIVSCEDVLNQFGVDVSEDDVLRHAVSNDLCDGLADRPEERGGTTVLSQAQILTDFGVPARPAFVDSLEAISEYVESGQGIIAEVNAGVLWNEPSALGFGEANHAVVVTGVARDPETGAVLGVYINDSGRGFAEDSGRFVDAATMEQAWLNTGGMCVVTDAGR